MTAVPLTDEEYRLFREWLVQEFGLWFGPERREILRARLEGHRVERGFDSFHQLFFHLKFHPDREAERERLIPHLTNNESYLLRERAQLDLFIEEMVPALRRELIAAGESELRILSAGCSAGQEPYSIALLLQETGGLAPIRARITGVDLDPRILEQAREGRYTSHSFRGVGSAVRDRYFTPVSDTAWRIDDALRESVDFRTANLADPGWARDLPPQHVVFCRNVLIYFDADAIKRAARGLHDALAPGGVLFLGHAETLSRTPTPLVAERRPGAVFYRRAEG